MKETLSTIAVVLTFLSYIPYYRDIIKGKTKPHVYTWGLWSLLTILLVALQIKGGAGAAVWVTATAGLLCIGVVIFSLRNGNKQISTLDTIVAILSLLAIGFWLGVNQPVISIVLVILADMLAFVPTVRKTWHYPYTENLSFYTTNVVRFFLAFLAIEKYTFLSASWIVAWMIANGLFSVMLVIRRKQLRI